MTGALTTADGVAVRYGADGAGEPALVLVHCWGGHSGYWHATVAAFRHRHRVVILDLPGHGQSGRTRAHPSVETFADDVVAVVRVVGVGRAILVGHSMGGQVAAEAARRLGAVAIGLVLVDTMLAVEQPMKPDERRATVAGLRADFRAAVAAFMRQNLFAASTPPAIVERVVADGTAADPGPAADALESLWAFDSARAFEALSIPIRAINADLAPTDVEGNRRHARDYDAAIMRGVGHYPMLEDPVTFNARLRDAVGSIEVIASR